jgi:hypothetical protein
MTSTTTTTTVQLTTAEVRADRLRLGDVLLVEWWDGTRRLEVVTSLELLGDDVEWNSTTSTSRSNKVQVVR